MERFADLTHCARETGPEPHRVEPARAPPGRARAPASARGPAGLVPAAPDPVAVVPALHVSTPKSYRPSPCCLFRGGRYPYHFAG